MTLHSLINTISKNYTFPAERYLEDVTAKEKLKFLSKYSCGFTNNVPNICCPLDSGIVGRAAETTSRPASPSSSTPSSSGVRLVEEVTESNFVQPSLSDNDLRIGESNIRERKAYQDFFPGFNEWTPIKCSTEFCGNGIK